MKTLDEVKKIAQQLNEEYKTSFAMIGNSLTTGVGTDEETGSYCIFVYLATDNLSGRIPAHYQEVKVKTKIIGPITAL